MKYIKFIITVSFLLYVPEAYADEVDDGRIPVVLLEISSEEGLDLRRGLSVPPSEIMKKTILEMKGMVFIPLPEPVIHDETCQREVACLFARLPDGTMALDLRFYTAGSDRNLVIYDLRLLVDGYLVSRISEVSSRVQLEENLKDATETVLKPHLPMMEAYRKALEGDERAKAILMDRYPESPWTRAALRVKVSETEP